MIKIASGNIMLGVRYIVANETDHSGILTYSGVNYAHGDQFVGQSDNDTYSLYPSGSDISPYEDDTDSKLQTTGISNISQEISTYNEDSQLLTSAIAENFNENDNVVFPEFSQLQLNAVPESDTVFYFQHYSVFDYEQLSNHNNNFIPCETKIYINEQHDAITEIVGNALYNGVTYDELISLNATHPEIILTFDGPNNISKIEINNIVIIP